MSEQNSPLNSPKTDIAETRKQARMTGIPYARELGESRSHAMTQSAKCKFFPFRLLVSGEKQITPTVSVEAMVAILVCYVGTMEPLRGSMLSVGTMELVNRMHG